jgi:ribosomal protein S18 acetylase RimI-like enzyme
VIPATTLRPVTGEDLPFLYDLYASTRLEEVAMTGWPQADQEAFLAMQFHAQHTFYQEQFAGAQFDIIERDGEPIGRLYVDRRPDEIRIIDIALLPAFRGRGIGSRYLKQVLAEGQERGLPVRIHVEANNPAMRLYKRLGFRQVDTNGVYWLMEWTPAPP